MTKILLKFLFTALVFSFVDVQIFAQKGNADSVEERVGSLQSESVNDTSLIKKNVDGDDSLQEYKSDRDFAYIKYLDSLLRHSKKMLADTLSENNVSSAQRKERSSSTSIRSFNLFNQPVVKIFLWLLAIFFIGYVLYKLFNGENFFRRNSSYTNVPDAQPEDEFIPDASAYDKLIAQAAANKNFRLAVRYLYLQCLQKLADAGAVQLSANKTNYQYVHELSSKPYGNDFAAVTLNYEYVWYGKFELSEENIKCYLMILNPLAENYNI